MSDKKELYEELNTKVENIRQLLKDAEKFADDNNLTFSFEVCRGAGATYYPKTAEPNSDSDDWCSSDENGWVSSSSQC